MDVLDRFQKKWDLQADVITGYYLFEGVYEHMGFLGNYSVDVKECAIS